MSLRTAPRRPSRAAECGVGTNRYLCRPFVAVAALALHRRAALPLDRERVAWLAIGVVFAAGLACRDAPPLKLLALGCATLTFALAAHRLAAVWVRRAGVLRYAGALALGALHGWTAAALALIDMGAVHLACRDRRCSRWRSAAAVARGRDRHAARRGVRGTVHVGRRRVRRAGRDRDSFRRRVDRDSHPAVSILAWLSTGYLRGLLTGTALTSPADRGQGINGHGAPPKWLALGITEVATALAAIDLLFLVFVIVQFRYPFGADALVQIVACEYRDRMFPGAILYPYCFLSHQRGSTRLVVSRGVSDLLPIRWRCRREVVLCYL